MVSGCGANVRLCCSCDRCTRSEAQETVPFTLETDALLLGSRVRPGNRLSSPSPAPPPPSLMKATTPAWAPVTPMLRLALQASILARWATRGPGEAVA